MAVAAPAGWWLFLHGRSSARERGMAIVTAVIDGGYRGEIIIGVGNTTGLRIDVASGERLAQIVPIPIGDFQVYQVADLPKSERGERGFGSSGK